MSSGELAGPVHTIETDRGRTRDAFRNFPTKEHLIAVIGPEQQADRALFEALDDEWLENDDIRAGHAALLGVLDALVVRAQAAGAIRADVGAIDVLCMTKGMCEASRHFEHLDPGIAARQLDLVRAALTDTSNR